MKENFSMDGIWNGRFLVWNGNGMEKNCRYEIRKNRLPFHTMPWQKIQNSNILNLTINFLILNSILKCISFTILSRTLFKRLIMLLREFRIFGSYKLKLCLADLKTAVLPP